MATWSQIMLIDSLSPPMEALSFFHDHTMTILLIITITVAYTMMTLMYNKYNNRFLLHGHLLEIVWTTLPAVTLIFIALPSLHILYLIDDHQIEPNMTIKTIGHQWFWSYEYSDFKQIEFDSYMKPTSELNNTEFRLLDVDNRTIIPFLTQIRMMVTSSDVLHSWTIPALGVKIDATPGRLNQINFSMNRPGLYFGQCSEICGANHSFMPIVIESVSLKSFTNWIKNN
uniref:Cytochrome c oxidase subunit 2 n=1 Tax=Cylindraustralia sp. HS-2014 TaxID=1564207 RepID=A0A0N7ARV7_9ORTH|nr:cytochrome c oxidase subunit 2 [Cylindraustralia sp. HS-2014]